MTNKIVLAAACLSLFGFGGMVSGEDRAAAPAPSTARAAEFFRVVPGPSQTQATLTVHAGKTWPWAVPRHITGKFAEHLGANIYQGMDAQVLRNPSFADFPFWTGQMSPDGVTQFMADEEKIQAELRRQASRAGWPAEALDNLTTARADGLAAWWGREGARDRVTPSPDAGEYGGRAQRVQVRSAGEGIGQWVRLPLHRVRRFEFLLHARSPNLAALTVSLSRPGTTIRAQATVRGLARPWSALSGTVELPGTAPAEEMYWLALQSEAVGEWVVDRLLLRPADHISGADPDVIRWLRESRLPILRWPGGNFVSGYHWEDGVGPLWQRPTRPNYAWGGVEPNFFGVNEFIQFCRAVGCEPMICANAGSGTPAEAARWIEYCNSPTNTPLGALRAAHGFPQPHQVKHWEVGNELWGRWQYHWTTPSGNADRYVEFSQAMLAADPTITLYACGAPVFWGKNWNDTLIQALGPRFDTITDHPLIGGNVPPGTDPLDVYRDFMAVPGVLERKWADLGQTMASAGIAQPRLAVTELQLFAHLAGAPAEGEKPRLTPDKLVNPGTLAEALYDILIYHAAVRLTPLAVMVTHSATVNHGGGLRKEQERVYANPCHYAQSAFAAFAGAAPVATELATPMVSAPRVLPDLRNAASQAQYGALDALAAVAADGGLLLSLVHRGTAGPIQCDIELRDFPGAARAETWTLTSEAPWAANRLKDPERVKPTTGSAIVADGRLRLTLQPYTVLRLQIPR